MRALIFITCLLSQPLIGQERHLFAHFEKATRIDIPAFAKDNDQILLVGELTDQSLWVVLEAGAKEDSNLRSTLQTDVVFWNQRRGKPCNVAKREGQFTFVKYESNITKFNVQDASKLFRLHDEHINKIAKTGNIVLEGFFDNDDGGFMLMRGTVDPQVILTDPAVVNGIIEPKVYLTSIEVGTGCP